MEQPESLSTNQVEEYDLWLTLEEILKGCTKEMKIVCKVTDPETGDFKNVDKTFKIKVKSGTEIGTRFPFSRESGLIPDLCWNVVFVLKDLPHSTFKRINQFDIEYIAPITIEQIQIGCEIQIPTLENDPITFAFDENMITENLVERFCGRGLTFWNESQKLRGDLVVRFKIGNLNENGKYFI